MNRRSKNTAVGGERTTRSDGVGRDEEDSDTEADLLVVVKKKENEEEEDDDILDPTHQQLIQTPCCGNA